LPRRHHLDARHPRLELLGVGGHVIVLSLIDLQLGVGLLVRDQVEHLALKLFLFMLPVKAPVWA
jgi:hypothetical protein